MVLRTNHRPYEGGVVIPIDEALLSPSSSQMLLHISQKYNNRGPQHCEQVFVVFKNGILVRLK